MDGALSGDGLYVGPANLNKIYDFISSLLREEAVNERGCELRRFRDISCNR